MKRFAQVIVVVLLMVCAVEACGETVEWIRQLGSTGRDEANDVSADGLGNIYISGLVRGTLGGPSAGETDAFVSKYDAAGNFLWTRQFGTERHDYALSVSTDGLGNAYVSGRTDGKLDGSYLGNSDAFGSKYSRTGVLLGTRQLGTTGTDISYGISADGLGSVYISGNTTGSLGGPNAGSGDTFLSKYSTTSSNLIWTRQIGTAIYDYNGGVSADGLGNVYTVYTPGHTSGSGATTGSDVFLNRHDSSGSLLWTRQLGTTTTEYGSDVSADGLGNVYISGSTLGGLGGPSAGLYDAFVSKYDAAGSLLWARELGTASNDYATDVTADGLGNVYISGTTHGGLGGSSAGFEDAFVSKFDAAGILLWTLQIGTARSDYGNGISADGQGNVYLTGYTRGSLGGPNAGVEDAFLVKISDPIVPEPSTLALAALCVLYAAAVGRRTKVSVS